MTMLRACSLADLGEDKPLAVEVADTPLVLVRRGPVVHALRDECSHAEIPLSEGEIEMGRDDRAGIVCWLHGSRFDLHTGAPCSPPATEPVEVYPAAVVDGDVFVDLDT
ncbi:MAG: non-heme iron oxygenase ferredoxin subunit [Kutzneria sp.]|nr:non-heme iron oxygenase ferredoxin subunit [Kutzneria sp.]